MIKYCPECELPLVPNPETPEYGRCVCGWFGHMSQGLTEPRAPKMGLTYVSIDIETTGLNEDTCQVLEVGAVYDDWSRPVSELPVFRRILTHEHVFGEPYAMSMHPQLLRLIATKPLLGECPVCGGPLTGPRDCGQCACGWTGPRYDPVFCRPDDLTDQFAMWLTSCGWNRENGRLTPAGKNFASFDRRFLKPYGFNQFLHHRTLDPAPLYWQPGDTTLPDMGTCKERAGLDGKVAHTAVEDALDVVHLIRFAARRFNG